MTADTHSVPARGPSSLASWAGRGRRRLADLLLAPVTATTRAGSATRSGARRFRRTSPSTIPASDSVVSVAVIETIENRYAGRPYRVELVFPEYTSICPLTGAPDFGNTQRMRIH
jgi:hypothetical protein